ncbi:hypothetical protein GCM10023230_17840 [Flavobacterium hankyongi]|uniref:Acyltransferase 3 domain-containing protein n=2 Tax=Flavobacteriaceae TaxID=49546 RepID=A0ABP8ZWU7_9FLAO
MNRGFPHYNDLPIFHRGTEAVFAFFCLSGFLIIRNLFIEKEKDEINLKKFYLRRILRILPLYYLVLIIGLLFYHLIAPRFGFTHGTEYNLSIALLLGFTFFPNILATYAPGGIIEILWSIGIEEQFYIFIAPVIYRLKAKSSLLFLVIFTIFYFILFHFGTLSEVLIKYGMYFFYFSFSGIIAYYSIKIDTSKTNPLIGYIFYILSISIFFTDFFKNSFDRSIYNFICMISFPMSIYFLSLKPVKLLENKILIKLGEISYGIYMYHVIVFQLVGFIFFKTNINKLVSETYSIVIFNFAVFIFTISISYISYHYFEKKFLKLKTY